MDHISGHVLNLPFCCYLAGVLIAQKHSLIVPDGSLIGISPVRKALQVRQSVALLTSSTTRQIEGIARNGNALVEM